MTLTKVVVTDKCDPPPHLSPSSIGTWVQCPLRFKYGRIDKIPEPSTQAQILGSFTHEILEFLYSAPQGQRTIHTAKALSKQLWEEKWGEETSHLMLTKDEELRFRWQVWWCVEALFKLEDPTAFNLGGMEQKLETHIAGTKLLGILDRWHLNEDGLVVISDYKTGKKPAPRYEEEKKFQLAIYIHLVQNILDLDVAFSELLYLKEGLRWVFKPEAGYVEDCISKVEKVADEIRTSCSAGEFEARPARLCDWCSFKKTCPAWK